ncbi:methylmalonyl Co-A mutase-associated GTPase MeaB [Roseospirillum parvum]|uniref:LAO/AO transport system kinase n=1 Tax=Roseospirillum parvum TaxID=83401 RepID=A0A1G8FFI1_9PROT|nr:methylmalonyl Co-A mutase-associated GTPase MeaB [Roseospirillum parvum]SDH80769.1 LAO/AO transport system kinase [Roseospirillum parvum]
MTVAAPSPPAGAPAVLLPDLLGGRPAALARAITEVENETPAAADILAGVAPHLGRALVVGLTGPPGAGKSTLLSALIKIARDRGFTIGVVAVDPSSPRSGGALLGDRVRMNAHAEDPGVFLRSLSARGHLGGLSPMAARVVDLMDAAGRDLVLIETVGTGQSEVEIAELADTKVVVAAPGLGDGIQAIKAGILEIADILAVNKADLPGAEETRRHLAAMVGLGGTSVPVLATTAESGDGVAALFEAILDHARGHSAAARRADPGRRLAARLADSAAERLRSRLMASPPDAAAGRLLEDLRLGRLSLDQAVARLLGES